ncbi:MAG: hypothetical protein GY719_23605, partial [bacterium]|nr:hypothetical protein [bacterium]
LTTRTVAWPVFEQGEFVILWVTAIGRRFWCPVCHSNTRVAHPGVGAGARYAAAAIAALLHLVGAVPFGVGTSEADAFRLARGHGVGISERGRSGRPRWTSIRRWIGDLEKRWPALILPTGDRITRLHAALLSFGLGLPGNEVVGVAVLAQARGGMAM